MIHIPSRFGRKKVGSSEDMEQTVFSLVVVVEDLNPHCDFDIEETDPDFSHAIMYHQSVVAKGSIAHKIWNEVNL